MKVREIEGRLRTATAHGLNGVVFSSGLDLLSRKDDVYFERLKAVKSTCDSLNLELIPIIFSVGYGSALPHNRNLAEGLLVTDSLFTVKENLAVLTPDHPVNIENGGFEDYNKNTVTGYKLQDQPGDISIVDTKVFSEGKASLRFQMFKSNPYGNARVMQEINVKPHRLYRVIVMLKTDKFEPVNSFKLQVLTIKNKALAPLDFKIKPVQDWQKTVLAFNSGENTVVRIYAGAWGGKYGRFWLDDLRIEELGPVNILRRSGTPVTVRGEESGIVYEEGKDFEPIADPELNFYFNHEAPPVKIPQGSRIKNGEKLRLSYYHGFALHDEQVVACMSEPELYAIWKKEMELLHKTLGANKYVLSMDEVRMGGTCKQCKDRKLSMAEILGDCITKECNIIKGVNSKAEIFIWSDMLDPNQNAKDKYYLVDGDFTGSWKYIPKELGIICWYFKIRIASLMHFEGLGFKTLAGAYYDGDNLENPKEWLKALDSTKGATGIMYTTWENRYELLPGFGDLVSKRKDGK